jgi:hypothetical protein
MIHISTPTPDIRLQVRPDYSKFKDTLQTLPRHLRIASPNPGIAIFDCDHTSGTIRRQLTAALSPLSV